MNGLRAKQIVLPVLVAMVLAGSAFAQVPKMEPGKGMGMGECRMSEPGMMIPGLTEEQQTQLKAMRVENMKAMQALRNQLGEKKARLRTLTTADKVNMAEVNKMIDEIGTLQTKVMRIKEQHRQDIRQMLNDEQRLFFDARGAMRGGGEGQGRGACGGDCEGDGPRHEATPHMR